MKDVKKRLTTLGDAAFILLVVIMVVLFLSWGVGKIGADVPAGSPGQTPSPMPTPVSSSHRG